MCGVRQILFLPLGIFDSYVSLIQNKIFFGTTRRISNLTNLAVTSWALAVSIYARVCTYESNDLHHVRCFFNSIQNSG